MLVRKKTPDETERKGSKIYVSYYFEAFFLSSHVVLDCCRNVNFKINIVIYLGQLAL